jgi:hypothetical protein
LCSLSCKRDKEENLCLALVREKKKILMGKENHVIPITRRKVSDMH